jgi:hypothetical protein
MLHRALLLLACALQVGQAFHVGVAPAIAPRRAVSVAPAMIFGQKEKEAETAAAGDAEQKEDGKALMQKVKDAGAAGIISYIFWEWAFWGVSVPVAIFAFKELTGHWPDFSNQEDLSYLGGEAFAFVNVARFAVPLRIGLALGTTPWVQANIVDRFKKKDA